MSDTSATPTVALRSRTAARSIRIRLAAFAPRFLAGLKARRLNFAWAALITAFCLLGVCAALVGFHLWRIPEWYLRETSTTADVAGAINRYRAALAPVLVGLLQAVGGAAILYGLWLTSREQRQVRSRHVLQRMHEAIANLDSDRPATRLAAAYELETIAIELPSVAGRIIESLSVSIQHRTMPAEGADPETPRTLGHDALTAIVVVDRLMAARGGTATVRIPWDLRGADLRALRSAGIIRSARLDGADLSGLHFTGWGGPVSARRAKLRGATFTGVTWYGSVAPNGPRVPHPDVDVAEADLTGAVFDSCAVVWVGMNRAKLDGARFRHSLLSDCDLSDASMRGVVFEQQSTCLRTACFKA